MIYFLFLSRSMKKITEMDILTSEDEQKKVLKDNGFCVIGDISDTTFTFSKKYSFVIITSSTENNGNKHYQLMSNLR